MVPNFFVQCIMSVTVALEFHVPLFKLGCDFEGVLKYLNQASYDITEIHTLHFNLIFESLQTLTHSNNIQAVTRTAKSKGVKN